MPWIFSDNDSHLPPAVGPTGYAGEVLADSPWVYWQMRETDAITGTATEFVKDSSGNNRDADVAYTWQAVESDHDGPAAPSRSYQYGPYAGHSAPSMDTPFSTTLSGRSSLSDAAELTLEFWMQSNDVAGNNVRLSAAGHRFSAGSPNYADAGILDTSGLIYVNDAVHNASIPNDSLWHHYVMTKKITSTGHADVKIYIDGVLNNSANVAYTYNTGLDDYVYLESSSMPATRYISEIAVYTTELSAARIAAHYAAI